MLWHLSKFFLLGLMATTGLALSLYDNAEDVVVVENLEHFENTIMTSDSLWMVQFCDGEDDNCQKMVTPYTMTAAIMKGVIRMAVVDFESPGGKEIVERFGISLKMVPALYWFLDDKNEPRKIENLGSLQTMVAHMVTTVGQTVSDRVKAMGITMDEGQQQRQQKKKKKAGASTVTVTGEEEWEEKVLLNPLVSMVAFTAPWCGHCKLLKPDWDEAAEKIEGQGAQFVWVDATDPANEPVAGLYQVQGFPTILLFPGGAPKVPASARQYPGERKAQAMVKYALMEVDATGTPKEIPELINADILQEECQGHNHICVLAALPHILDSGASGRNNYRDLIASVSKTFRGGAFSFLWFEGGSQPALEEALQLTFGYPALVAYSMDRHAYAVLHGSFSEKRMTSFLHGVTSGKTPVVKLAQEKVPKIETVGAWNGEDAAPPEEEFDLADIMGWDDDDDEGGESGGEGSNDEL